MKIAKDEFSEYERKDIQHREGMKFFKEQVKYAYCVCVWARAVLCVCTAVKNALGVSRYTMSGA